jgi:hypothetical protein
MRLIGSKFFLSPGNVFHATVILLPFPATH